MDVREEAADQTAIRIFGILRILKYKPPTDSQNLWAIIVTIHLICALTLVNCNPSDASCNNPVLLVCFRSQFRQGIVQGDKSVIYPILEWLLARVPDLKKRAYLAKYLVKLDVPPDFMAEPDIGELFVQVRCYDL